MEARDGGGRGCGVGRCATARVVTVVEGGGRNAGRLGWRRSRPGRRRAGRSRRGAAGNVGGIEMAAGDEDEGGIEWIAINVSLGAYIGRLV